MSRLWGMHWSRTCTSRRRPRRGVQCSPRASSCRRPGTHHWGSSSCRCTHAAAHSMVIWSTTECTQNFGPLSKYWYVGHTDAHRETLQTVELCSMRTCGSVRSKAVPTGCGLSPLLLLTCSCRPPQRQMLAWRVRTGWLRRQGHWS